MFGYEHHWLLILHLKVIGISLFCRTVWHVGSYFPDQGLNLRPLQ